MRGLPLFIDLQLVVTLSLYYSCLTPEENITHYNLISICPNEKTENSMFIPKEVILNIIMPITVVFLIISSAEILKFCFCPTS